MKEFIIVQIRDYLVFILLYTIMILAVTKIIFFLIKLPGKEKIDNKYKRIEDKRKEEEVELKQRKLIFILSFIFVNVLYLIIKM